jgi:proline iminopeptidase
MRHSAILFSLILFSLNSFASQINGLYYNTFGNPNNPALVFLHGGPGYNSFTFEVGIGETLANKGYYVVVYDQRGSGRSAAGVDSDYTLINATQDLADVLQASHAVTPILLGHSWGGTLAIEFMKLHPGEARATILIDAAVAWPQTVHSMIENSIQSFHNQQKTSDEQIAKDRLAKMFPNGVTGPYNFSLADVSDSFAQALQAGLYAPKDYTQEAIDVWQKIFNSPDSGVMNADGSAPFIGFYTNENLYLQDFTADLLTHRDMTYAMYGTEDGLFSQTWVSDLGAQLPKGHMVQVPGASHFLFLDQPTVFLQTIDTFVGMIK